MEVFFLRYVDQGPMSVQEAIERRKSFFNDFTTLRVMWSKIVGSNSFPLEIRGQNLIVQTEDPKEAKWIYSKHHDIVSQIRKIGLTEITNILLRYSHSQTLPKAPENHQQHRDTSYQEEVNEIKTDNQKWIRFFDDWDTISIKSGKLLTHLADALIIVTDDYRAADYLKMNEKDIIAAAHKYGLKDIQMLLFRWDVLDNYKVIVKYLEKQKEPYTWRAAEVTTLKQLKEKPWYTEDIEKIINYMYNDGKSYSADLKNNDKISIEPKLKNFKQTFLTKTAELRDKV